MSRTTTDAPARTLAKQELVERLREKKRDGKLRTYPLSFGQERLWFLDLLEPGNPFYNLPLVFRVTGPLDLDLLRRTFGEIMRRHQVLRTRIVSLRGRPVQLVDSRVRLESRDVDLSALAPSVVEAEFLRQAEAEARRPFQLTRGPMLRMTAFLIRPERHGLVVNLHHIAGDGGSLGLLVREVRAIYEGLVQGEAPRLADPPIQYFDFAIWQRRWLQGAELERQLAYWRTRLEDAPPLLELPLDRPRPAVQSYRGATVAGRFDRELSRRLEERARQEKTTVFVVLAAGFKALLSRLTGQKDVIVGTAVANRSRRETESLIGFFVNTLVLRSDLSNDPTFRQLVERVRDTVLGAYAHQDLPFERLVEALQPQRALAYSPLFQVMLVVGNAPQEDAFAISDLEFRSVPVGTGTAQFDLSLYVSHFDGCYRFTWHFNRDLFDRTTVGRFAEGFRHLLSSALADPGAAVETLPAWSRTARHQWVREWNDTRAPLPETTVHGLIEEQVRRSPGQIALICGAESLSFEEVDQRANRLARRLLDRGLTPGAVVGLYLERGLEAVVAMVAVLKAGGAYLPLDPTYPQERLAFMVEDADARFLVTSGGRGDELRETAAEIVDLDREAETIAGLEATPPAVSVDPRALAYVIYTSGSTGRPKGVMIPHGSVVNFFAGMDGRLLGDRRGTWLAVTSISFDISVLELLYTLSRGFRTVIQSERPVAGASVSRRGRGTGRRAREMEFSLFYFAADTRAGEDPYRLLFEGARFADRRGFTAIWTPERHFHAFGGLYPNPSVTSAALAAITEKIQIRAGSVVLPLHHAVRVAEEWSLVDNFSKGRVALSFASGWHADDFVLAPENYAERKEVMFRDIETVRKLWRGEAVELPGGSGSPVEVAIHPRPVQAELPVWVTAGGSPDTFRRAGEIGAHLLTHLLGQSVEELAEKIRIYRRAYRQGGDRATEGCVTLMLHTFVGESLDEARSAVRGPFTQYLETAGGLLANQARSLGLGDVDGLSTGDLEALLDHAFERYFQTSGLMGTLDSCSEMVDRLRGIGVDEIGCLIDFGIDPEVVMAGLERLDELRCRVNEPGRRRVPEDLPPAELPGEALARWNVSHLQCTPSMATLLAADTAAVAGFSSLEKLILGGEALPVSLARRLHALTGAEILNVYGPTETTVWSTTASVPADVSAVTIGRPIANTGVHIYDRAQREVPAGVPGQLCISGEGLSRGYLGRPAATAERFLPDPQGGPGSRSYATGDLARRHADGELEFLDRIDRQLKIRGYRIEPGEIESVLCDHAGVREAAVVSRRAHGGESQIVAYVVPEAGPRLTPCPEVDADREEALLRGRPSFTLPNGMIVTHYDGRQAEDLYREVFVDQVYRRHGMRYSDGDTIFDVGANAGFFTLFASQVCRPARIFAFEPIPDNCELLRVNAALYDCPAEIYRCGLAEAPGTAQFAFYPHHAGLSGRVFDLDRDLRELHTFARHGLAAALGVGAGLTGQEVQEALEEHLRRETLECRLMTLTEVIREHRIERIDMLKIDAEKSEIHVLEGLAAEDWPKVRQVMLEVHSRELLERTEKILESQGFALAVDEELALQAEGDGADLYNFMVYARRPEDGALEGHRPATAPTPELLKAHLRERLPDHMVPAVFVSVDELPLTPNGKIDRKALPEPAVHGRAAAAEYIAPRTETERRLSEIWQDILRIEKIGLADNFFEIGGSSLLLVQAHQRLRRELGAEIPLVEMFRHPTIGSMADYLGGDRAESEVLEQSRKRVKRQAEVAASSEALERQRRFLEGRRQRRRRVGS